MENDDMINWSFVLPDNLALFRNYVGKENGVVATKYEFVCLEVIGAFGFLTCTFIRVVQTS